MGASDRRRRWPWVALGFVVLAAVAGMAMRIRATRTPTARVERRPVVQTVVVTGRVMPKSVVDLAARLRGTVTHVAVDEGAHVTGGQLLVALDDAEVAAAAVEAQAAVQQAAAELRRLRSKGRRLAGAALERADTEVEQASKDAERARTLAEVGAMTDAELEQAKQALALAQSRRQTAAVELASATGAGADVEVARTAVARAKAALDVAQARLDETRIRAPAAGVVLERAVDPGDAVQPGSSLIRLAISGPTHLEMEPDERNLRDLAVGQRAVASAEAFPDRTFAAQVDFIAPAVDPDRGTVEVKLAVPHPPDYLRADMTVSIEVIVGEAPDALVVPRGALRDASGARPWVLRVRHRRAERQPVRLGVRGDAYVQVRDGLKEGDRVVVDPEVQPGDRVRRKR